MMVHRSAYPSHQAGRSPRNTSGISTMTVRKIVLAALAAATLTGTAMAEDRVNITPTLYREQARVTASVRPASELTTTPSLTPRAPATRRLVADADASAS